MAVAGVAWGIYSLRGRGARRPLASNAVNFARAVPGGVAALAAAAGLGAVHVSPRGLALAAVSGGITSGLGYAIWYAALRGLDAHRAGLVQLAVPVLAALGGVAWLGERVSLRLAASGALVLGGIALALVARRR
jgi:drug/metabolite transporter (DMT)-like permease